jgi:hypothetical protein
MVRFQRLAGVLALCVAACGPGGGQSGSNDRAGNGSGTNGGEAKKAAAKSPVLPPCPFRNTSWKGSIEGGRLLVTGTVDLQMAGFKPQLSVRSAAPPVLSLDLALAPAAGEPVTEKARYEKSGSPAYRRGEIWCGGERIADFEMIFVG